MAVPETREKAPRRQRLPDPAKGAWRLARWCVSVAMGVLMLGALAAGLAWFALQRGPVPLPLLAGLVEREFNESSSGPQIRIGSVVVAVSRRSGKPALRFHDVEVFSAEGEALLAVPRMGARFHIPDLLQGDIRVTEVLILRPEATLWRTEDGGFRFGLALREEDGGAAPAPAESGSAPAAGVPSPPPDAAGAEALARVLSGLSGAAPPIPETERLSRVIIRNAALSYIDQRTGEAWRTDDATLRLVRTGDGLSATLDLALAPEQSISDGTFRAVATQHAGSELIDVKLQFIGLRPQRLAGIVEELEWLSLIDAPLEGTIAATVALSGEAEALSGTFQARNGRFSTGGSEPEVFPFDEASFAFDYETELERLHLRPLIVRSDALETEMTGFVDIGRDGADAMNFLSTQLSVAALKLDVPSLFAEPLSFDGGEVLGRVTLAPFEIDIASARLSQGEMQLDLSGRLTPGEDGWVTDLRAAGRKIPVSALKTHWPVQAARNARKWVVEHIESGEIDQMVAQLRLGRGEPQVALDFTYRDLVSRYLGDMPEIRGARGRGHLRLHEFLLEMSEGTVYPRPEEPVALAGSSVRISDLWGSVTPADIRIRGQGGLGTILDLIDREPLRLIGKLGLDPASVSGQATVTTELSFPLISQLLIEDIEADAVAELNSVDMVLPLGRVDERLAVRAERLSLRASDEEMTLSGPLTAEGVALDVDWREVYGATPGRREVVLRGAATPALLARFDAELPGFDGGSVPMTARISQTGDGAPDLTVEADLGPAALEIPKLGWSKAPGQAGRLTAEVLLGSAIEIRNLDLSTAGLSAKGRVSLTEAGEVSAARLSRVTVGDLADLAIEGTPLGERGLALTVRGRKLDLDLLERMAGGDGGGEGESEGTSRRLSVDFDIDSVVMTESVAVEGARGRVTDAPGGALVLELSGLVNGSAPVSGRVEVPAEGDGKLSLDTDDAGAFLRATGLAEAARDGTMTLRARLVGGEFDHIDGLIRLKDVTLREAKQVESLLARGGAQDVLQQSRSGGLRFSSIRLPFVYREGVITLDTSIASGPMLAVKLDGTIEEESGKLDLSGVISPAYAVTGALNNIPLLGQILSGGEGEGILAMTFGVGGTIDDPSFSVNPLSLLTPGFLRRIFTGKAEKPDERFLESLGPDR